MNIQSTFENDIRSYKSTSGAYEWWYFDAVSDDGETSFVIIFYEGNPFSRRYIKQQQNGSAPEAGDFPAISISIYHKHQPVYYSFTEVEKRNASFGKDVPLVRIGNHQMKGKRQNDAIIYHLTLDEKLPSGDALKANITFKSRVDGERKSNSQRSSGPRHHWHIIQPRAVVNGHCKLLHAGGKKQPINFMGKGYHDHNLGSEPLNKQFADWYWGRFHFTGHTFVYYVMDDDRQGDVGWLIENDSGQVVRVFEAAKTEDISGSLFGLTSARKLLFTADHTEVLVQQSRLLDNGPFYQRFNSDAFCNMPSRGVMESISGITEYLCPPRIYNPLFWPLTNMRIRYKTEPPHWVQRSKTLYRWTW